MNGQINSVEKEKVAMTTDSAKMSPQQQQQMIQKEKLETSTKPASSSSDGAKKLHTVTTPIHPQPSQNMESAIPNGSKTLSNSTILSSIAPATTTFPLSSIILPTTINTDTLKTTDLSASSSIVTPAAAAAAVTSASTTTELSQSSLEMSKKNSTLADDKEEKQQESSSSTPPPSRVQSSGFLSWFTSSSAAPSKTDEYQQQLQEQNRVNELDPNNDLTEPRRAELQQIILSIILNSYYNQGTSKLVSPSFTLYDLVKKLLNDAQYKEKFEEYLRLNEDLVKKILLSISGVVALSFDNKYYFYESDKESLKKKYNHTFEIANKQRVLSIIENFKETVEKALKENRNPFPIYKLQKHEYVSAGSAKSRTVKKPLDQVFEKFMHSHNIQIIPTEQNGKKTISRVYQVLYIDCQKNEMARVDIGKSNLLFLLFLVICFCIFLFTYFIKSL